MEQLSEAMERRFLSQFNSRIPPEDCEPYGVLMNICVIRDLNGIGWEHVGAQGQEIIKAVMSVATDNYPELMRKCYMINTPWLFHTVWTLSKISVLGTDYMSEVAKEIPVNSLPSVLGGEFNGNTAPFLFDTSEGGLLSF
eukprot:gene52204-69842_t